MTLPWAISTCCKEGHLSGLSPQNLMNDWCHVWPAKLFSWPMRPVSGPSPVSRCWSIKQSHWFHLLRSWPDKLLYRVMVGRVSPWSFTSPGLGVNERVYGCWHHLETRWFVRKVCVYLLLSCLPHWRAGRSSNTNEIMTCTPVTALYNSKSTYFL